MRTLLNRPGDPGHALQYSGYEGNRIFNQLHVGILVLTVDDQFYPNLWTTQKHGPGEGGGGIRGRVVRLASLCQW